MAVHTTSSAAIDPAAQSRENPDSAAYSLRPVVAGSWPAPLRVWFGRLMAGKAQPPPALPASAWQSWLNSVEKHGLGSLLFSKLRTCDSRVRPPSETYAKLKAAYFAEAARIMVRRSQLEILLKRFEAAGIKPLVLKGAALGEMVYEEVFQRPAADIDILVPKAAYEPARTVLLESGYRSRRGSRSRQMEWNCDEEFIPAAENQERQYVVELHWSLTSHARLVDTIETANLFARAQETAALSRTIEVLHPVDALVFACLHLFYKHINELRLIWLYDIHLLAERVERLGLWHETVALSRQWQARLALKNCLELAHQWFQTPLPELVVNVKYKAAALEELQLFNLVAFQLEHGRREGSMRKHLFQLKRLQGWNKYYYLKSRLFPTRQEIEANYPRLRRWPGLLVYFGRFGMIFLTKK